MAERPFVRWTSRSPACRSRSRRRPGAARGARGRVVLGRLSPRVSSCLALRDASSFAASVYLWSSVCHRHRGHREARHEQRRRASRPTWSRSRPAYGRLRESSWKRPRPRGPRDRRDLERHVAELEARLRPCVSAISYAPASAAEGAALPLAITSETFCACAPGHGDRAGRAGQRSRGGRRGTVGEQERMRRAPSFSSGRRSRTWSPCLAPRDVERAGRVRCATWSTLVPQRITISTAATSRSHSAAGTSGRLDELVGVRPLGARPRTSSELCAKGFAGRTGWPGCIGFA